MTQRGPWRLPDDLASLVDPRLIRRPQQLTTACYTFPHWHRSALSDELYGPGWTEYVLMRGARPWFPGHHQPRTPLLGELDERDPATWVRYVDIAVASGVDVFIFDWYWYGGGPALHEALEDGYLRAPGRERTRFAVMWTNHPWAIWFPTAGVPAPDDYLGGLTHGLGVYEPAYPGPTRPEDVWRSMTYLMARYFHDASYWRIADEPVLAIWDMGALIDTFGLTGARALLDELRAFARRLGHTGVHVHAVCHGQPVDKLADAGVDSYGLYNPLLESRRPADEELADYGVVAADVVDRVWPELDSLSPLPCFPSISPGWDDAPRHLMRTRPEQPNRAQWPGTRIIVDETPAAFEALVQAALAYLNARPHIPPVVTIGCWNEWTEGHYLLPDTRLGYGMARALARGLELAHPGDTNEGVRT